MSILDKLIIVLTFKILIDVQGSNSLPAERLTFETSGVELAGTLNVTVSGSAPPPDGAQYRVVSTLGESAIKYIINLHSIFNITKKKRDTDVLFSVSLPKEIFFV